MSLGTPPCQRRRTQRPPVLKLSCLSRAQTVAHVAYGAVNLVPCAAKQAVDGMGLSRVRHRLETQGTHTVEIEFLSQRPPQARSACSRHRPLFGWGTRSVMLAVPSRRVFRGIAEYVRVKRAPSIRVAVLLRTLTPCWKHMLVLISAAGDLGRPSTLHPPIAALDTPEHRSRGD